MKIKISKEKLTKLLLEEKLVEEEKLKELLPAAKKQKKSIFQVLSDEEVLEEIKVIDFMGRHLEIPTLNLSSFQIPKEMLKVLPKKMIEKHRIMPIARVANILTVVTSDPFDLVLQDDVREISGCELCFVLVTRNVIDDLIEEHFGSNESFEDVLGDTDDESLEFIKEYGSEHEEDGSDEKSSADDAPVVRMVNVILSEAIKARASDIHFEPYEKMFRVRYRIDGSLKEAYSYSREMYGSLVARMKIMSVLDITEKRLPQDGRFRVSIGGQEIDFRVSILPIYHGEKMVLRVLDRSSMKSGLDKLGFSEKPTSVFAEAIERPYGMILVTGPTGSGKSTTLYTILNTLNTPNRNIMTVEDPVEYQVEGITQTQVHAEVGLTFASGLRSLLRQSPDIILIGEMRDTETADIGVKAALTGHLVFSTLHTNSAAGAVTRLLDMGMEPFLIASSVICVAAQRLVRRICTYCKEDYTIPEDIVRRCGIDSAKLKKVKAQKGKGCAKCNQTGYFGRVGAIEVLKVDSEIHDMIIERVSSDAIHKVAVKNGMETLFENAFGLFEKGTTTLEEVLRVSSGE